MIDIKKIVPIQGNVLVEISKIEEKAGSIFLHESSKQQSSKGKVVAIADASKFKEGDVVYFKEYSGSEIDENLKILEEKDILAKEK